MSTTIPLRVDGIPKTLRDIRRWICWREGKIPTDPEKDIDISALDPVQWMSCANAVGALNRRQGSLRGIGLALTGDGVVCVDLDHVLDPDDPENILPWAAAVIDLLDSYTEISVSGTGLHIFVRAVVPFTKKKPAEGEPKGEVFSSGQYVAMTGHRWPGNDRGVEDRHGELLQLVHEWYGPEVHKDQLPPDRNGSGDNGFSDPLVAEFNQRADWTMVLKDWTLVYIRNGIEYWRRPGKDKGISATVGYKRARDGAPALYVFTSSVPGLQPDRSYDAFGAWTLLHHGGDWSAARRVVENALKPKPIDHEAFPVEVLPQPLRSYITEVTASIGCDESFVALPTLATVMGAIGGAREVEVKPGWREPAIAWMGVVGESGTAKSPAQKAPINVLNMLQAEQVQNHDAELEAYEAAVETYERDRTQFRRGGTSAPIDPPVKPEEPQSVRYVVSDTTIEALAPLLKGNPRGLLLSRDELSSWLFGFDKYHSSKGSEVAQWLEMHNAGALIVDRRRSKSIVVPSARISVSGGIQPAILDRILQTEFVDGGLLPRFLLAYPPRKVPRWSDARLSTETGAAFGTLVRSLLALDMPFTEHGEPVPLAVPLSPAARKRWVELHNKMSEDQEPTTGGLCSAISKLQGYRARFALLIHTVRKTQGAPGGDIHVDDLDAAEVLVRWFLNEARRIYAQISEKAAADRVTEMLEMAQAGDGILTVREWLTAKRITKAQAKAQMEELVQRQLGAWKRGRPRGNTGGRISEYVELVSASGNAEC